MKAEESIGGPIRLEIPSDFRWLDVLNASLMAMAEELDWDQDFTNAVTISAIEAASNAVEHGNGLDTRKRVRIDIELDGGRLVLGVSDEGPGVDPGVLDRPPPPPDALAVRGRGFSIMKALMDEIRFRRNGDGRFRLEMEKAVPGGDGAE